MKNNHKGKVNIDLSDLPLDLLSIIQEESQKIGNKRLVMVGGIVRDKLISFEHKTIQSSKDIDLLVEGSASKLALAILEKLGNGLVSKINIHKNYDTAEIEIDGNLFDITTARKEIYMHPGHNPKVLPATIEEDLSRRDFSINAIALDLELEKFIDIHDGQKDIQNLKLKLLHPKSIEDDPTRVIRAARYSSRLALDIDRDTINQIKMTINKWPWEWKHGDNSELAPPALSTRLKLELEILFSEENWLDALQSLYNLGGLKLIDNQLPVDRNWLARIKGASGFNIDPLTAFLSSSKNSIAIAQRFKLSKTNEKYIIQSIEIQRFLKKTKYESEYLNWLPSKWTEEIEKFNWDLESIKLCILKEVILSEYLLLWIETWRKVESPISANTLLKQGWETGPRLGDELRKLRKNELDKINE